MTYNGHRCNDIGVDLCVPYVIVSFVRLTNETRLVDGLQRVFECTHATVGGKHGQKQVLSLVMHAHW